LALSNEHLKELAASMKSYKQWRMREISQITFYKQKIPCLLF